MPTVYDDSTEIGSLPKDFRVSGNEWQYLPPIPEPKWEYVCRYFKVIARVHDPKNGGWGRIIQFQTDIGVSAKVFILDSMIHDSPRKLAMILADAGLAIHPTTKAQWTLQLLLTRMLGRIHTYVNQSGWRKNDKGDMAFVLPSGEVVGAEGIIMRPDRCLSACEPQGTATEWRQEVGAYAVGNSRLALAISMTFAAPMLRDTNRPNGGVHFEGESQSGKTTITQCAASVMGNPSEAPEGILSSWHSTPNAVEGIFARSNDCILPMDEMSQAAPNDVAQIIYKLGNGAGKGRMRADSSFRDGYQWRTLAISTGEEKAENKIRQARGKMTAGIDARLANVPSDAGKEMGIFENLHGFTSPKALADHLRLASKKYYGTAFPAFIKRLVEERLKDDFLTRVANDCEKFMKEYVPVGATSQVRSVAHRFALAAVAGELATEWEILPWKAGTATAAAVACMKDWMGDRGSVGQGEHKMVLDNLREYISANMLSKFPEGLVGRDGEQLRIGEIVGLRTGAGFAIFKDCWKRVMPDVPAARAMKILAEDGFVSKNIHDSYLTSVNTDRHGSIKCYVISDRILD